MTLFVNASLKVEHADLGNTPVVIDDNGFLTLVNSAIGDIEIINGGLIVSDSSTGVIDVTDGTIVGSGLSSLAITLASANGAGIYMNGLRCSSLTVAGGSTSQEIVIDRLDIPQGRLIATGTWNTFSITSATIGQVGASTTFSSGGLVDFTDLSTFTFEGQILRAWRNAIRLEDCVAGHVDVHIVDPGVQADNSHDAVNLIGACGQLYLAGTVYGAVNQANNPRYAIHADAGTTTPVDVFMSLAGYQTGAVDDDSGGSVIVH